jgi:hypothetical protein
MFVLKTDGRTKDRRSCQDGNRHVGRDAIFNDIFDLGGAGSLFSDGRGEGGGNRRGIGEDNEPDIHSVRTMGRTDGGNRDEGA